MNVKSSSIGLSSLFKKPNDTGTSTINLLKRPGTNSFGVKDQSQLSIFKRPRMHSALKMSSLNTCYNGMGSSEKVLQSDLKPFDLISLARLAPSSSTTKKIKKLAPLAKD